MPCFTQALTRQPVAADGSGSAARTVPEDKASRKRAVSATMKEVSEFLGNTPTLARTAYVDPRVVEAYEHGRTIKVRTSYDTADARQAALERAVLRLLEDA